MGEKSQVDIPTLVYAYAYDQLCQSYMKQFQATCLYNPNNLEIVRIPCGISHSIYNSSKSMQGENNMSAHVFRDLASCAHTSITGCSLLHSLNHALSATIINASVILKCNAVAAVGLLNVFMYQKEATNSVLLADSCKACYWLLNFTFSPPK